MNNTKKTLLLITILMISFAGVAFGSRWESDASAAESDSSVGSAKEYISDVMIASGASEEEAFRQLKDAGYTPVMKNIAAEKPELATPYVYAGYKTTTDPASAVEKSGAGSTGSVFGESALMIAGIALIIGVVIGMISMRVRPREKKETDECL